MVAVAAALAVAAGIVAGTVVAFADDDSRELTRAEYLAQVAAVCETYGKQLDLIPPPTDPASPGAVFESIGQALPILRQQAKEIRALEPPRALRSRLNRFFDLTDRSILALERARDEAGKRALFPMVQAISAFEEVRDRAKQVGREIGFDC